MIRGRKAWHGCSRIWRGGEATIPPTLYPDLPTRHIVIEHSPVRPCRRKESTMATAFNDQHLEALQTMACPGVWPERNAFDWMRSAQLDGLSDAISSKPLSRSFLKEIAASSNSASDRDVLWSILAWGGIKRDAARRLSLNEQLWVRVVGALRRDNLDRRASYDLCADAVHKVKAGGIGPAYFTKLIFFANPRHDGFIMDQWTARSVNLLVDGPPVVRMRTRDHVDPRNNSEVYERFCRILEELSSHLLNRTAEETEQCLFSTGGKNAAAWRRYLVAQGG
jgi:hypothetical protein